MPPHKDFLGLEVALHAFLISALGGGEASASRSCRCDSGDGEHFAPWIGVWVGSSARLDVVVKKDTMSIPKIDFMLSSK
jgi:hypothetical protein